MIPDVPTVEVRVRKSDSQLEQIGIRIDILNQLLLTLLIFIPLQILRRYQFVVKGFSMVCAIT